jgi:hypothetical protein
MQHYFRPCFAFALITATNFVFAESELWQLDGKLQVGAWSSNRSLDNHEAIFPATVALKGKVNLTDDVHVFADGRVGHSDYFADENRYAVAREFYLDYTLKNSDVRIGKQLLPWGRADRINPTDSLTSRDYRWLAAEEEDARYGNTGIRYNYHLNDYTLTGVWMPSMSTSRIPLGTQYQSQVQIKQPDNLDNFAAKLDYTGTGLDGSLSFYNGVDTSPTLEQNFSNSVQPFSLINRRIQRYGADAAVAMGSYTLRTEMAYTQTGKSNTEFSGKKYDYFQSVVGIERQFANSFNVNFQMVWQSAFDWRGANSWQTSEQKQLSIFQQIINQQPARNYLGIAYRVSKKLFNDNLELELSGLGLTANQGFLMRPRVRYQVNDESSLVLGGDYYNGDNDTIFGRLNDNKTVFLEANYNFSL